MAGFSVNCWLLCTWKRRMHTDWTVVNQVKLCIGHRFVFCMLVLLLCAMSALCLASFDLFFYIPMFCSITFELLKKSFICSSRKPLSSKLQVKASSVLLSWWNSVRNFCLYSHRYQRISEDGRVMLIIQSLITQGSFFLGENYNFRVFRWKWCSDLRICRELLRRGL